MRPAQYLGLFQFTSENRTVFPSRPLPAALDRRCLDRYGQKILTEP
ncbi:hypothetical protein MKK84_11295 [Methylobacterium sp. E-065]|nr:hypothetical protein [Methylobacterium sp. E-065]MCJ2018004.1 hypothetical protein [Methylobacterium sp. E-065]